MYNQQNAVFAAYNFGMPGYGPQHMLSVLSKKNLEGIVKEKEGMAIYTILPDHVYRAIAAPYVVYGWGSKMPYYFEEHDSLTRIANFSKAFPFRTLAYKVFGSLGLSHTALMKPAITKTDIALTVSILKASQKRYLQMYPNSKFYVLCYPFSGMEIDYQLLVNALHNEGINTLDYRQMFPMDGSHTIAGDGHPNFLANQKIAARLLQDLH
ncbi:MAG: hypothetical protein SFW35_03490 [Chitinophagales bacterium]|nr:hypothetical protein [Chitinophagales bacterium]